MAYIPSPNANRDIPADLMDMVKWLANIPGYVFDKNYWSGLDTAHKIEEERKRLSVLYWTEKHRFGKGE